MINHRIIPIFSTFISLKCEQKFGFNFDISRHKTLYARMNILGALIEAQSIFSKDFSKTSDITSFCLAVLRTSCIFLSAFANLMFGFGFSLCARVAHSCCFFTVDFAAHISETRKTSLRWGSQTNEFFRKKKEGGGERSNS